MSDLISIITPAYNAARHIAETINSVRTQTYQYWELIVVDDGSTDDTKGVVTHYCVLDARVRYIYQPNGRQGKARNHGLSLATGTYVAFLDSDDLWLPTMLAEQLRKLQAARADLVYSDAYAFSDQFDTSGPTLQADLNTFSGQAGMKAFLVGNRIPILTVLCKREAVDRAGGFSENPLVQNAEDYHLWLKMLLTGSKLVGLNHTLAAYRRHSGSVSTADGLNPSQGVEARYELIKEFPASQEIILPAIRHAILTNLAYSEDMPAQLMYQVFNRYLEIAGKTRWKFIIRLHQWANAKKLALRSMYFIINYL